MPKFEVGDVILWAERDQESDLGSGPFVVVGEFMGLVVFDNLDGSPLKYHDMRAAYGDGRPHYYMYPSAIRRDEFLTAVRRAKLSQEKCAKSD